MWRHAQRAAYEAGGMGAAVGPQWGPGAKPLGGGTGGKAPGKLWGFWAIEEQKLHI